MTGGGVGIEGLGRHIGVSIQVTKLLKSSAIGRIAFYQLSKSRLRIGEIPHQSKTDAPHVLTHNRRLRAVVKAIESLKCFGNFPYLQQPLHGP